MINKTEESLVIVEVFKTTTVFAEADAVTTTKEVTVAPLLADAVEVNVTKI